MLNRTIDNRGLPCPRPVLNTKKALDELSAQGIGDCILTIIVDNEAAKENVARFAARAGCKVTIEEKEDTFYVAIKRGEETQPSEPERQPTEIASCQSESETPERETIFVFKSSTLGQGSEELGGILMRSLFFSIKEMGSLPSKMLFLNSGVHLTTSGSPVLEEIQELEAMGVEILSCGTCLDYFQLGDKLQIGRITNMYDTVNSISSSAKCVTF